MSDHDNHGNDFEDESIADEVAAVAQGIYMAHLPRYLQESWSGGRGRWHEDWLREQLDVLVTSEISNDPVRLAGLQAMEDWVALVFGIFGTTFRILDHMGMHVRGQTFGQYELLPEDGALLGELCQRFLESEPLQLTPFS